MPTVTKLDAARRQLETACRLYFDEGDLVSIHTLAAAAYEILETLATRMKKSTLIQEGLLAYLSEDLQREVRVAMRTPQNFFKHADRDPEAELELTPDHTELLLLDAIATYLRITGNAPAVYDAFANWFFLQHPELLSRVPESQILFRKAKERFGHMERREFVKGFLASKARSQASQQ